jgi:glutamate-1-semialdehyde 2,1-aminomutase
VYDRARKKYIDYVLSYGALILGHAATPVINAVQRQLAHGGAFGVTHASEIECARRLQAAIPLLERMRFVSSGTEAVMGAIRLARGYTGRDIILKFENAYHGHADYLLAKGGSGLATLKLPMSAGVPRDFIKHTFVLPRDDVHALKAFFKKYGAKVAAVIVEPVGGNYGVMPPDINFLRALRTITRHYGTVLIFDEVITGFRFHFGSAADLFHIKPDLMCLGKIVGGGFPIGVYGGRKKIMDLLAPSGPVYQASTFAGHPVIMRAACAALDVLKKKRTDYCRISTMTERLAAHIKESAERYAIKAVVNVWGPLFSVRFLRAGDFKKWYQQLLMSGVYCAPSEYEANFVSFAHTDRDIAKTISTIDAAFKTLSKRR